MLPERAPMLPHHPQHVRRAGSGEPGVRPKREAGRAHSGAPPPFSVLGRGAAAEGARAGGGGGGGGGHVGGG